MQHLLRQLNGAHMTLRRHCQAQGRAAQILTAAKVEDAARHARQ
ncbi:hypothetical protein BN2476_40028 [Paraburkholderia piptadeniae]|uniref:Uncharacterized protein n=1 Tax=Paraburkholderia piptadeniae TaxID=1701573 RepID=A0A1N7RK51_9BURK|nr:hypothetical protein BN2476_40028 [Paraburkholderia piptadeniae]